MRQHDAFRNIKTTVWFWGKLQEMRLCRIGLRSPALFQENRTSPEKIGSHLERASIQGNCVIRSVLYKDYSVYNRIEMSKTRGR